jgi:hypothetical protein
MEQGDERRSLRRGLISAEKRVVNYCLRSVVVQIKPSHFTISTGALTLVSLKAKPPQSNTMWSRLRK